MRSIASRTMAARWVFAAILRGSPQGRLALRMSLTGFAPPWLKMALLQPLQRRGRLGGNFSILRLLACKLARSSPALHRLGLLVELFISQSEFALRFDIVGRSLYRRLQVHLCAFEAGPGNRHGPVRLAVRHHRDAAEHELRLQVLRFQ